MAESKPKMAVDFNDLSDDLKPYILMAASFLAWQMQMPAEVYNGLFGAALAMLKINIKLPGKA